MNKEESLMLDNCRNICDITMVKYLLKLVLSSNG